MFSKSEIEFIAYERVARLATINVAEKSPHVVPICFAFDGKTFFTTLHFGSKRLRNVEQGSSVAILVDRYEEKKANWKILRGLLIYGNAKILAFHECRDEFMYGWKLLIQKYPQYRQWSNRDLTPRDSSRRRIMRIEPTQMVRWGFE